jgi:hypothetical protein
MFEVQTCSHGRAFTTWVLTENGCTGCFSTVASSRSIFAVNRAAQSGSSVMIRS